MHCAIIILASFVIGIVAAFDPLLVDLSNGKLRGRDNKVYYSYEAIPYAEPPLGDLRFEAPQPYAGQWNGTFDASKNPVLCMQWSQAVDQPDKLLGNEDCLTVSVYKPKKSNRKTFPVVVDIHGGAFTFTATSNRSQERLMDSGNFILVKFYFRLGPLGFISTGDSTLPGNNGLKDQRLALRWIKQNIANFGGDPENILVLGHSSGAASVHFQLLQEDFKHLAKVAISFSGNALDPWAVQTGGRQRAFELGRILGCGLLNDSTELKKCLQSKNAREIVKAVCQFQVFGFVPFTPFGPVIEPEDGAEPFLTQHPIDIIESGKFSQVPWLVGTAQEDGTYNAAFLMAKQTNGKDLIEVMNSRWFELAPYFLFYRDSIKTIEEIDNYSRHLRQEYLGDQNFSAESYSDVQRMFTDVLFRNGTVQAIDLHRKNGKSPVYGLVYDNPSIQGSGQWLAKRSDINFGTGHGDDFSLLFVSGSHLPLRADEEIISKKLIKMLEVFVLSVNQTLTYDSCVFPNNFEHHKVQFLKINRNSCEIVELD